MAPDWFLIVEPEADHDLRRLRRVRRKAWQVADGLLDDLVQDPFIGAALDPPFVGCRRIHFWNDSYRLVWRIDDAAEIVYVLGCDLKSTTFYSRMEERFFALTERLFN